MSRKAEFIALLLADAIALFTANFVYSLARFRWGWLGEFDNVPTSFIAPCLTLSLFWLVLFFFFGLYKERYAASRFDELVSITKTVTIGLLILFFVLFIWQLDAASAHKNMFFYWLAVIVFVSLGRITIRSIQKALILRGYGLHKALIVGWSDRVETLYDDVARYPEAGLKVVGAIRMQRGERAHTFSEMDGGGDGAGLLVAQPVATDVYTIEALPRLIDELGVQDVLIALGSNDNHELLEVLSLCDGKAVSLKLVPDFYTIIGGMSRTEHMYGLPLIEVLPEPMPPWEQSTKRLLDVFTASLILLIGLPVWVLFGIMVRLTSPGPAIYRQQRVGQNGEVFTMLKFRTMKVDAEAETGPVWAQENDPRYTPFGRWLRKTRLDEVPQFWNVLKGDMSLVGPRPERPYFVERLARDIPLYNRRHRVKPGITGWAQVKWKYDESLEDVRQKVKYDLFYIENVSLRMDLKILFRTIRTTILGKGR